MPDMRCPCFSLIMAVAMAFGFDAEAIVDSKGRESTQFFVDYSTGEVTPFECETYEDLWRIMDENLVATCTYHNGEHGAIVEWCIPNGVFSNFVTAGGSITHVWEGSFYWYARTGAHPSRFIDSPSGMVADWDAAYMCPGAIDSFEILDGKTAADVRVSVVETDVKSIGQYQLMPFMADQYDSMSIGMADSSGADVDLTGVAAPVPAELCDIQCVTRHEGRHVAEILVYFGQYQESDWSLQAVTRIKYEVSNARYIPGGPAGVTVPEADSAAPQYFNLNGLQVERPVSRGVYIVKTGGEVRKVVGGAR